MRGGEEPACRLHRHLAADPASVALLLAGPTPRQPEPAGDTGVLTLVAPRTADVPGVIVAAPRRHGVGFVATIDVSVGSDETVHGLIVVEPADDPGCELTLTLETAGREPAAFCREAARFLDALAHHARSRSLAA